MDKFAVLIPLGPNDQEIDRMRDLLDSLFTYEPQTSLVVMVDDSLKGRNLAAQIVLPSSCKVFSILNPRRRRGDGWSGGMTAAVLAGLALIEKEPNIDFVLKLDSDALIIAPFVEKISKAFARIPDLGILGSGSKTINNLVAPAFIKLSRKFTIWRRTNLPWKHLQISLWGNDAKIRRAIIKALSRGYKYGEHVQGGAYAISQNALHQIARAGYLDNPLLWLHAPCTEDSVVSLLIRAEGFKLYDFNADNEPFGLKHRGLPDIPVRLIKRGFSIIHSVKSYGQFNEEETRSYFYDIRQNLMKGK